MIFKLKNYLSLVKFAHTIFAMPFALLGFSLAIKQSSFNLGLLILVILCMIFTRNAAMGFNRFIDRKFDAVNERTAKREIPSGIIKPNNALIFVMANSIFFIIVTFFINKLAFYLSPVALAVILGYSFCKRFTALSHLVLGTGLALAPIGAYIAVMGKFDVLPLLISFMVLFWVSGFDIIYALQDMDFDKSFQLKSIPSALGISGALKVSRLMHLLTFILVILIGCYVKWNMYYWIGAFIFNGLLVYQHTIVKSDNLSRVNVAFFSVNGFASLFYGLFSIIAVFTG